MLNWLKNTNNSRQQSVDGKLVNSTISFGDTITNIVNIPKKILLNISLLLIILIATVLVWRGNFQTVQVNNGTVNQIQGNQNVSGNMVGGNLTINQNEPSDNKKLIYFIQIIIVLLLGYFIYFLQFKKSNIKVSEIVDKLLSQHHLDKQAKDKQIKALTKAITTISKGKDIIATKSERKDALADLARGNTTLAKKLLNKAASEIELKVKKDAEIFRDLSAFAFVDKNKQEELVNIHRAEQLAPKRKLLSLEREVIIADVELQKLKNTSSNSEEVAIAYNSLGIVYKTLGNFDKAIQYQKEALEIAKSEINQANIYANLGRVYQRKDDFDKSVECYTQSLKIAQESGYKEGMAVNYYSLGNIYKQNDKSQAVKYYQMSIDLFNYLSSPNEKLVQGWLDNLK